MTLPLGTLLVLGRLGLQCHLLCGCITAVLMYLYLSLFQTCTNRVIGVLLSDELH